MAENLADRLPNELWFMVMDSLDGSGLKAFSSLDQTCRELASPRLFSGIQLSNKTTDFESLGQFVEKHGHRVARIHYDCYLYPRKPDDPDDEGVLTMPEGLKSLLAGKGLPNLKTVTVKFHPEDDFDGMDSDWTRAHDDAVVREGSFIYITEKPETTKETMKNEFIYQWRADIFDLFAALALNKVLEHLEVLNLTPRVCSVWNTQKWKNFLERLTSFKLRIWGGDTGAGWYSNALPGYGDFIQSLRPGFFKHLASLKKLTLIAEPSNSMGGTHRNASPLPIAPEDLPQLEELELENCFVDWPLSKLICARKDRLRSVKLVNCMAALGYTYVEEEDEITWAEFLEPIVQAQPTALVEFAIDNEPLMLHNGEGEDEETKRFWRFAEAEADIQAARQQLEADKRLRLFKYGGQDDKYGNVVIIQESTFESFMAGDDQAEYDALMKLVDENQSHGHKKRAASDADVGPESETAHKKQKEWKS